MRCALRALAFAVCGAAMAVLVAWAWALWIETPMPLRAGVFAFF
jgi:hypothetical protein